MIRFSLLRFLPSADLKTARPPFKGEVYNPPEAFISESSAADNPQKDEGKRRTFGPSSALISFYQKHESAVRRSKK